MIFKVNVISNIYIIEEGRRDVIESGNYYSNTANGVLTFTIITDDVLHGKKISKVGEYN